MHEDCLYTLRTRMHFMYLVIWIEREGVDHFDIFGPHFNAWTINVKAEQYLEGRDH